MDELIIDEKRYISSKQAAKITGYAKDYIGQLCREGRVPARLVGRSWYVLEAAIHDHRFGAVAVESAQNSKKTEEAVPSPLSSHMEAPRYEAVAEETVAAMPVIEKEEPADQGSQVEDLQESWRAWFSEAPIPQPEPVLVAAGSRDEPQEEESEEVMVPVRAIHHSLYQPSDAEVLPRITREREIAPQIEVVAYPEPKRSVNLVAALQLSGALLALIAVATAVLGTGYFDAYLLSNRGASLIAGVSMYNK